VVAQALEAQAPFARILSWAGGAQREGSAFGGKDPLIKKPNEILRSFSFSNQTNHSNSVLIFIVHNRSPKESFGQDCLRSSKVVALNLFFPLTEILSWAGGAQREGSPNKETRMRSFAHFLFQIKTCH
jgi:hypothetical protein